MNRRYFLTFLAGNTLALTGCQFWPTRELFNPCYSPLLPEALAHHDIVTAALADLDGTQLWDGHVHMIGAGDSDSGILVNPHMRSILHPVQYVQFKFFTNA
ncbi:MAG: amidohydrolase, partial [Gammaproteobacteria bacterium]